VEIDGERAVVACRFGGVSHVSFPGQMPLARMRHREGNVLKDQAYCERLGASPLNSVECEKSRLDVRMFSHNEGQQRSRLSI
jgi:hypothetical protein